MISCPFDLQIQLIQAQNLIYRKIVGCRFRLSAVRNVRVKRDYRFLLNSNKEWWTPGCTIDFDWAGGIGFRASSAISRSILQLL